MGPSRSIYAGLNTLATTASRTIVDRILTYYGWTNLFELVMTGDDVTNHKPHPECYLKILARLGTTCEDAVAFEDSETGVAAAKAAGINVIKVAFEAY